MAYLATFHSSSSRKTHTLHAKIHNVRIHIQNPFEGKLVFKRSWAVRNYSDVYNRTGFRTERVFPEQFFLSRKSTYYQRTC